jgi:EmrB/QacA subfamily drug resistance transporter
MRAALRDPEVVERRRWFTLLVLCISLIVIVLDNTILNVALPRLSQPTAAGGLAASQSQLQWIVDSYTIVFAGLLLTAGSIGDRFGRYRSLAIGLAIFGTGSVLSAFATDANVLIGTRALMGVGGAFIMPSTLSILTNVFRDHKERGKAIGIWAGVSALGLGIGPVSGGILLSHFWWGSVFLVNVPFVIGGLVLGYLLVPESKDESAPKLDPGGALLSIVGLGMVLWAVIEAPSKGWTSAGTLSAFVGGAAILVAFFVWESRSDHPMLDLRFFQNPRFSAASGAITVTFLSLFGVIFLLTQYLQLVLGYSTVKAGAILLPQAGVIMIAAPMSSMWVQRFGNKVVVATGLFIVSASMFLLTTLDASSGELHVILVTVVLGLGMGNIMAPATDSIMGSLPRAKAGVGSAVNDTTRQVGGAVGVAVFGSLLASRYSSHVRGLLDGSVPERVIAPASDSIGRAFDATLGLPADTRNLVLGAARESFVRGLHTTAVVASAILLATMLLVIRFLPARHREDEAVFAEYGEPGELDEATEDESVPVGAGD